MRALKRGVLSANDEARPPLNEALGDLRFRALLSPADWARLPLAVRRRFSKRLSGGETVVYAGEVTEATFSRVGWCLAQAARLMGGPLPLSRDTGVPSVVTVTEDTAARGQFWTRLYARRRGFPQVVHSSKRFAGPTGLEEYVGSGVGMALTIHVEDGASICLARDAGGKPLNTFPHPALKFRSAGYFLQIGAWRLRLPGWMTPGALTVTHADMGEGRFMFSLEIEHPRLGMLVRQSAVFRDP